MMSEQTNNMAPGQQNFPSESEPQGNPHALTADEIREGANQEDQLDGLKENATEIDKDKRSGAAPTAYQYKRKTKDNAGESHAE